MPASNVFLKAPRATRVAALTALSFALVSCGGGGDSGGSSSGGFSPVSSVAGRCAAPRTGIDPFTGVPYPDRQGSLLDEQNWLASWTNEFYLWYGEVPRLTAANYPSAVSYFDALKTLSFTASGKPKDQFHFTYPTQEWEALSQSGIEAGYGAAWVLLSRLPPRRAVVAYTEPGSPATLVSPALARGAQILQVDGVDVANGSNVDALTAGLFPVNAGETHQFVVLDPGASTPRTISMVSANVTSAPVKNVRTVGAGSSIGYMLFNDHVATAEPALINAITQLKAANVTDLVLDIRYNGGGYLAIASELAYMIAGPTQTQNKTFELSRFNDKNPSVNPITGQALTPTPFYTTTLGFTGSTPTGTALPHLDLAKVYVLTGPNTCSASEAVMNSLRGVGVQVIQIGSTTCGKPYGFYPADNCGTTYFSIQFQGVNALGFGDYADGFAPQNGITTGLSAGAVLPGCSVADDFTHALGDPAERRLAAALQHQATGVCPLASGVAPPGLERPLAATEGAMLKSPLRANRILDR